MKTIIEVKNRKSAVAELKEYCLFSMQDKHDFLEVTQWTSGGGYDVLISDINGDKTFHLTYGQMKAFKKCIKSIEKCPI